MIQNLQKNLQNKIPKKKRIKASAHAMGEVQLHVYLSLESDNTVKIRKTKTNILCRGSWDTAINSL